MDFSQALRPLAERLGRVVVVERTGSTSADLDPSWPDRSLVVAEHQEAGRGRAGREWVTPPGEALTFSVLLHPGVPVAHFGWLPLLGGLAVVRALANDGLEAVLKWPNDVLVDSGEPAIPGWGSWRKVAGVLGEVVAGGAVVGIGVNVAQQQLPVPTATSLARVGAPRDRGELLAAVVTELLGLDERWRAADGDAGAAGLAAECAAACLTIGAQIRAELPGGEVVTGLATGLAADGALRVAGDAHERVLLAGDVTHVRW